MREAVHGGTAMAHILVAEDDTCTCRALACLLRLEGHQVRCAADGAEALRLVRERPPRLLVLDLMMPVTDGFDVLREMGKDPRLVGLPVVAFSALGAPEHREKALGLGARAFVVKGADAFESLKSSI